MTKPKNAWTSNENEAQKYAKDTKPQDAESKNGSGNNSNHPEAPADFVLGYPENESFPEDESNLDLEPEESETKNNLDETPQKVENKDQENKVNEDGDLKQKIAELKSIFDEIVPSKTGEYTMRYEVSKNLGTYKNLPLKKHNENKFVLGSEFSLRYELSDGKVTKIKSNGTREEIKNVADVDKIINKVTESKTKDRKRLQHLAEEEAKALEEAKAKKLEEKSENIKKLKEILEEICKEAGPSKIKLSYEENGSEKSNTFQKRGENKFRIGPKDQGAEYEFSETEVKKNIAAVMTDEEVEVLLKEVKELWEKKQKITIGAPKTKVINPSKDNEELTKAEGLKNKETADADLKPDQESENISGSKYILLEKINKNFVEILQNQESFVGENGTITKSTISSKAGDGIKEGEAWNGEQFTYAPKDGDQSKKIVFSKMAGVLCLGEIPENNLPDASLLEIRQALDDLEKIKKEQKEKKDSEIIKKLNDTREEGGQKRSENVRRLKEILEEIAPNIGEEYWLKYRDQNGEEKNRKFVREGEEKFVSENENIMTYEFSNDDVEKEEGSFEMRLLGILSGFKIKDYKDISKEDLPNVFLNNDDLHNEKDKEDLWLSIKKSAEEQLLTNKETLEKTIKDWQYHKEKDRNSNVELVLKNLAAILVSITENKILASDEFDILCSEFDAISESYGLYNEDQHQGFADKLVEFLKKQKGSYVHSNAMGDEDLFFTTKKLEAALESSKTILSAEIKDNFSEILQDRDEVSTKNGTITKSKIVLGKEEAEQFVYTAKTADGKEGQPQNFLFSGDLLFLGDEEDLKPKLSTIRQAANDLAKFKQDLENESAIKIQSNLRGYNVRNDIKSEVTKTKSIENRDLQDLDEGKKTAAQQQKVKTNGRINSEKAKEFKASVSETSGEVEDLESEIPEVKKEDVQTPAFPNDTKIENELAAKVASEAITLGSAFAGAAISVAKKRELDEKAKTKPLVPAIVSENPAWSSPKTIAFAEGEEEKGEKKKGGEEAEEGKEDRDGKTPAFTVVERKTLSAVAAAERPIVVNVISEEIPKTIEEGEKEKEENKKEGEEKREKKNKTIAPLLDTGVPESIFSFASKLQLETTEKDKKSLNDQGSTPERKKDLEQTKKMLEDFFEKRISEINCNDTKNYTNDNKELLNTNKVMRVLAKISQALEVLPQEEDQNWAQNKIKEMISKDGKNSFKDSLPKGLILTDGDKSVLAMMCLKDDDRRTVFFGNSGGPRFNPQRINEDLANKIAETSLKLAQALRKEDLKNFKFSQTKDRLPSELSKELRGKTLNLDSAPSNSVENPKALKLSLKAYEVRGV